MPPFENGFPYRLEVGGTDYETYVEITVWTVGQVPSVGPEVSRIEDGTAWYVYDEQFSEDDYRNHCSSYYGGSFNACQSSFCSEDMCTDDCNMVCMLDQTDQAGPAPQVREVSNGVAWYSQDLYVTTAAMENHCIETYQGTFNACASAQNCTGNCSAVCLPGCFLPN